MRRIVKLVTVEQLVTVLFASPPTSSTPLLLLVIPPVPMATIRIARPEPVLSARLGASPALLLALPAVPLALPSTSLPLSISARPVIHCAMVAQPQGILLVKLVPLISSLSRIVLSPVWLLVQTTLPTSSSMLPRVSSVTLPVLPALPLSPSTAMLVPLATSN